MRLPRIHSLVVTPALLLLAAIPSPTQAQSFWINEFHYDNAGTDTGEFVEVVAPASFTDLATVKLTLYNGGDGKPYGTSHALSTFTPGVQIDGLRFYSKSISGLQNGAPDGFALDVGGSVTHFISYEGTFTAQAGPAAGLLSTSVHFEEGETTSPGSSVGLTGVGRDASQFSWNTSATATPGSLNLAQAVVPEPREYALVAGGGLLVLAFWRRRRAA